MDHENRLLSCIIITYNQGKYIYDAIESVLSQNYSEFELIIADDCSQDFDQKKLEAYVDERKTASLVKYTIYSNEKNIGTVKNINRAIMKATGKFIKIFGGDDAIAGEYVFSSQVAYLTDNPDDFIVTGKTVQCDENLNEIFDKNVEKNNRLIPIVISAKSKEEKHRLISNNYIFPYTTQAMCFRKEFFLTYGLYDERYQLLEDTPMMNRIIDQSIPVGFQDVFVIRHRTKVGISSADILYNARSLRYYEDCKLLARDALNRSETVSDMLKAWQQFRIASFRVDLCSRRTKYAKVLYSIQYFPNIVWYIISNPEKAFRKIKHSIKS